jgi:uncharacterized protein YjeT (DUF2065 family)
MGPDPQTIGRGGTPDPSLQGGSQFAYATERKGLVLSLNPKRTRQLRQILSQLRDRALQLQAVGVGEFVIGLVTALGGLVLGEHVVDSLNFPAILSERAASSSVKLRVGLEVFVAGDLRHRDLWVGRPLTRPLSGPPSPRRGEGFPDSAFQLTAGSASKPLALLGRGPAGRPG